MSKVVSQKELLDYIWFVSGPINPGTHNIFFNSSDMEFDPFKDYLKFQSHYRNDFLLNTNPVKAIGEILKLNSEVNEDIQFEVIELIVLIKSKKTYDLNFDPIVFEFDYYNDFKLELLKCLDKEKFRNKIIELLNQKRSENELIGIVELVDDMENEFINRVTLKIKQDTTLKTSTKVFEVCDELRKLKGLNYEKN